MRYAYPESREGVGTDFKCAFVDPVEELPEETLTCLLLADIYIFQLDRLSTWLRLVV